VSLSGILPSFLSVLLALGGSRDPNVARFDSQPMKVQLEVGRRLFDCLIGGREQSRGTNTSSLIGLERVRALKTVRLFARVSRLILRVR
jgi:hypothetical protein